MLGVTGVWLMAIIGGFMWSMLTMASDRSISPEAGAMGFLMGGSCLAVFSTIFYGMAMVVLFVIYFASKAE